MSGTQTAAETQQTEAQVPQQTGEKKSGLVENETEKKRTWEPQNEAERTVLDILSGPVSNAQANQILEDAQLREAYERMTGEALQGSKSKLRAGIKANGESFFYSDNGEEMRYNADINEQEGMKDGRTEGAGEGGQRNDGFYSGEQAGRVEEAAGRNSGGHEGGERYSADRVRDAGRRRSACRAFGQELKSTNDLGLLWGTDKKDLTVFQYGDSEEISAFIDDDEELSKVVSKANGVNCGCCRRHAKKRQNEAVRRSSNDTGEIYANRDQCSNS